MISVAGVQRRQDIGIFTHEQANNLRRVNRMVHVSNARIVVKRELAQCRGMQNVPKEGAEVPA